MRGRKPKPTRLRLIEGNRSRRPVNKDEPQVAAITGAAPPAFLDAVAKKEWMRLMRDLVPLGFVSSLDLGTLAGYCEAFSRFVRAAQKLEKTGDLIVVKGRPVINPLVRIVRDANRDMVKAASELGITPSSRSRVHVLDNDKNKNEDPAAEFFR